MRIGFIHHFRENRFFFTIFVRIGFLFHHFRENRFVFTIFVRIVFLTIFVRICFFHHFRENLFVGFMGGWVLYPNPKYNLTIKLLDPELLNPKP